MNKKQREEYANTYAAKVLKLLKDGHRLNTRNCMELTGCTRFSGAIHTLKRVWGYADNIVMDWMPAQNGHKYGEFFWVATPETGIADKK